MPQQIQIDSTIVDALLAPLTTDDWTTYTRELFLEKLLRNPQILRNIDTPEGEQACIELSGCAVIDGLSAGKRARCIIDMVREFCNYAPEMREPALRATLDYSHEVQKKDWEERDKAEKQTRSARRLKRAILALSPRERALLRVVNGISAMDGPEGVDFCNYMIELVSGSSLKPLRNDPSCRDLMFLYDVMQSMPQ